MKPWEYRTKKIIFLKSPIQAQPYPLVNVNKNDDGHHHLNRENQLQFYGQLSNSKLLVYQRVYSHIPIKSP